MLLPSWASAATFVVHGCGLAGLRDQSSCRGGWWMPKICFEDNSVSTSGYHGKAESVFTPLLPPAIPLAVRSPYLSTWLATGSEGGNGGYLAGAWSQFWPIAYPDNPFRYELGWSGLIRVDNYTYEFMGRPSDSGFSEGYRGQAAQRGFAYTSTQSLFQMSAGGAEFSVSFLSPISPGDLLRQSLPFSYMTVQVTGSSDGLAHEVQVYTDITAQWASGDHEIEAKWHKGETKDATWWEVGRKVEMVFAEEHEYAEWGAAIYAAPNTAESSTASGPARQTRSHFILHGSLTFAPTSNCTHSRISHPSAHVFAHSTPLLSGGLPAIFVVGHVRDPYVSYITSSGQEKRSAYWRATFLSYVDALHFFLFDYSQAVIQSQELDRKIREDALRAGGMNGDYAAIAMLSARQAMGTFEITVGKDRKGRYNDSDVMAFLKEISSNGDMSTVDVIFPMFPILTYNDPALLKYLLEPLFVYSESGLYPNKWTVHDIGRYPNATGHNDGNDEPMPVEEAANMLIMMLAYHQVTSDTDWLASHYPIMSQWASFLISDGLIPAEQLSTDDFAGTLANQTDLAIKAIIGIGAMADIAQACGKGKNESGFYRKTAEKYVKEWIGFAVSEDESHTKLAYQDNASWGTLYNLFGDRLLNLGLVPHSIYDMQSSFYFTVANEYGVPLDSRHTWAKTDWEMFAAATATSVSGRDLFIRSLVRFLKRGVVNAAFPDLYETETGEFPGRSKTSNWRIEFINRPVSGGHFALLALDKANSANKVHKDPFGRRKAQGFWARVRGFGVALWQRVTGFLARMFRPV